MDGDYSKSTHAVKVRSPSPSFFSPPLCVRTFEAITPPTPKTSEFDLKVFAVQIVLKSFLAYFFQLKETIVKLHLKIAFLEVDI